MTTRLTRILLTAACVALAGPAQAALVVLDSIAAIVDDDIIMESEFRTRVEQVRSQLLANNSPIPPEEALKDQVMERFIVESLQIQMAERAGVRVSDEELNEALASIAAQNSMNLNQFRLAIEADGIAWSDMREQIRREIRISRVQQGVMRSRIQISDQEIENFLESELGSVVTADEYRLAHILLPVRSGASEAVVADVRRRAEAILAEVRAGADFQSLAVEKSGGQNALEGGDLGWRKVVQLPTMFVDVAREMKVGETRGPIRSGSGFHLVKLVDKRGAEAEGQVPQTRVRHLLIKPSEIRTAEEARDLALTLREEVADGRDFEEVAKLYSEDPGSALSGGDLGWSRTGTFVPEFEATMARSEIGELSEVFETAHGFHFLEVTGRRVEDFSDRFREGQAAQFLRNRKFDEELENWIRELREDAFVEVRI